MSELTYTYLKAREAPKREDRLGAANALGKCGGRRCTLRESGCLKNAARSFQQTQGCQLYLASSIINTFINAVIVVHAPLGCASANTMAAGTTRVVQRQRDPQASGLIWVNSNLDNSDVVNGGEAKLAGAIRYADRTFRPQAILVASTCVPGIMGDDIENVINDLRSEVSAAIVPLHCEGFRSKIMATAYDSVYHGVLKTLLDKRRERKPLPVVPDEYADFREKLALTRSVNVFNVSSMSRPDELELSRLLTACGLTVRLFPCYAHPDDFGYIEEAALNVSVCSTHDDYFGGHLEGITGTPYRNFDIPIGTKAIRHWVTGIADFFGFGETARQICDNEEAKLRKALAPYRERLAGKRVYLAGGEIRALAMAEFLRDDLGMEIMTIQAYHYDQFADGLLERVEQGGERLFASGTGQPFEQTNILLNEKPDLYIGHVGINGWAGRAGFPVFPLWIVSVNYMGYSGAFEIARRLVRILRNSAFNRNLAAHVPLPYRAEWYAKDPYSYIKEGNAAGARG
ncbi:MAG: nitrogenase component 1 [Treponema sp.]|jgi:nitrogenase molybdenum-iron protein alpha chain|nr:nitrogenase component 1 [Treponema sp.]